MFIGTRRLKFSVESVQAHKHEPSQGQEGPLTVIPGIVFSSGYDGVLRALSASDGKIVWQFETVREAGPVVAGGMLFVPSGNVGVRNGTPGNVLLAFASQPE
jgi:polyvinyl alcohol dehydrogenase (cytochrome)